MSRRADPDRILRSISTKREGDSATYRVYRGTCRTEWEISRNDNELGAGGNPDLAWVLRHDEHGVMHECGRKRDALNDLALRYANHKPMFESAE